MNTTALGLMTPAFERMMVRDYLNARYPLVARARSASRYCRAEHGKDERYVWLYAGKSPGEEKSIGRCTPKTLQLFVDAGLWSHSSPRFTDHSPHGANEYWWRDE